jgi:hypothetical protein
MDALTWARDRGACDGPGEAIEWLESLPDGTTLAEAWRRCQRADWLLWALDKAGIDGLYQRDLRLHAVSSARRALLRERREGREPDPRSWEALRVARRYADGRATDEDLAAAWSAAWVAAKARERRLQADSLRRLIPQPFGGDL